MAREGAAQARAFQVRHVGRIPPRDAARLFDWGQDLWSIDRYRLAWRPWGSSFVGYLDEAPVTHTGVLTHTVRVDEQDVPVGGVAGVLTLPSARRQGFGARTLQAATDHLRDSEGVRHVLLFCRDPLIAFYGPLGWRRVPGPAIIQQPEGERPSPLNCLVLPLYGDPWPEGTVRLNSRPW